MTRTLPETTVPLIAETTEDPLERIEVVRREVEERTALESVEVLSERTEEEEVTLVLVTMDVILPFMITEIVVPSPREEVIAIEGRSTFYFTNHQELRHITEVTGLVEEEVMEEIVEVVTIGPQVVVGVETTTVGLEVGEVVPEIDTKGKSPILLKRAEKLVNTRLLLNQKRSNLIG